MEMLELMAMADILAETKIPDCPFKAEPGPANEPESGFDEDDDEDSGPENSENSPTDNYTVNKSGDLGISLGPPAAGPFPNVARKQTEITQHGPVLGVNVGVLPNAHHVIPGHASLPHSEVARWIGEKKNMPSRTKKDSRIEDGGGGIGYNVNDAVNGIWLPSNNALRGAWSGKTYQAEYAFLAINRANAGFHDAHTDYSEFVINLLDQISLKLVTHVKACQRQPCVDKKSGEKFPAPPHPYLKNAIESVSRRLSGYLRSGKEKFWASAKLVTSRFTTCYQQVQATPAFAPQVVAAGDKTPVTITQEAIQAVRTRKTTSARS